MSTTSLQLNIQTAQGPHALRISHEHCQLPLTEVLRRAQLPLNTRCGQRRHCDGCIVELLSGQLIHLNNGSSLSANGHAVSLRACEYHLPTQGSISLRIPARSALAYQPEVLSDYRIAVPIAHHPIWQQRTVPPSVDASKLAEYLSQTAFASQSVELTSRAVDHLATCLADQSRWAIVNYHEQQWVVQDITSSPIARPLGAAIDIGTTTVVLLLVDLTTGKILSRAADFNHQIDLGDNVVTRIALCSNNPHMVKELQHAVNHKTLQPLLSQALAAANLPLDHPVVSFALAGNTTMQHLIAGVDPSSMGVSPFTPSFVHHRILPAGDIFDLSPTSRLCQAAIHLLPSASAYVGADLTAGIFASGLLYDEGPSLLVDVGTNGEIIFKHGDKLLGCATAAGPAFEGAGLSSGMRAGEGAIAHLEMQASSTNPLELHMEQIGSNKQMPIGFCGSFYVDFLAQARKIGLLNTLGRFDPEAVPSAASRLSAGASTAFRVADGQGHRPLVVSETDIASLLSAKAAIAAGILILMNRAGVKPSDIKRVYLAGGFGTHLRTVNAIGCGLLPGFTPEQIVPVGNTALAGAYLALMDSSAFDEISRIATRIEIVELNLDPEFENTYIDQLSLPE